MYGGRFVNGYMFCTSPSFGVACVGATTLGGNPGCAASIIGGDATTIGATSHGINTSGAVMK